MKRSLCALCLMAVLLLGCGTAFAWMAEESFETVEDLPQEVRKALPENQRYLHGMRGGESLFLLMEAEDGTQHVLIFQRLVEVWRLDCESSPLDREVSIGCSGDSLHLFYNESNRIATFQRLVDGRWMLSYVQSRLGDFGYHPYFGLYVDWDENVSYGKIYAPDVNLITLDALDAVSLPESPAEAMALRTGADDIAVVTSQVRTDRLHLRTSPSKDAASLGRYYSGTPVRVLSTEGAWCKVSVAGVTGYMMREYLAFHDDMLDAPRYFLQMFIRDEFLQAEATEQIRLYSRPDMASAAVGTLNWDNGRWYNLTIIALVGDEWYHVICDDGSAGYVQQKYFWEGNG